jgi:hypothetical protein
MREQQMRRPFFRICITQKDENNPLEDKYHFHRKIFQADIQGFGMYNTNRFETPIVQNGALFHLYEKW